MINRSFLTTLLSVAAAVQFATGEEVNITVSADLPIPKSDSIESSPILSQNVSDHSRTLLSSSTFPPPSSVTLGFAMREIGMLECTGIDHLTGGKFFESIMGPGADASGNYLCQPTCGGECVPNQDVGVAPRSLYPFGCKCNINRCNAEGPIVNHFGSGRFKIICVRDTRCTCDGMRTGGNVHNVGYLCNWINLTTHRVVSFLERPNRPYIHPTYSPIRWCSCCPQVPQSSPVLYK